MNPAFWLAANIFQAAILLLAGSALSEMKLDQLYSITAGCHLVNFAIQLASQSKFGLSGNNVANVLQTKNKVWNASVLVASYIGEAIGRNLNSVPNVLLQSGIIDNDCSRSVLVVAQGFSSASVSAFVYWLVASDNYQSVAQGIHTARIWAVEKSLNALDAVVNIEPVARTVDLMEDTSEQLALFVH